MHSVRVLTSEMLYVVYGKAADHITPSGHSNPIIASFVTANCRLRLYQELEALGVMI